MFGMGDDDPYGDAALVKAARKRLLQEIAGKRAKEAQAGNIIHNNLYGGGGVMDRLGGIPAPSAAGGDDDPYSYFVDITRKDLPELNELTGKPAGWQKTVHRYKQRKDEKKK